MSNAEDSKAESENGNSSDDETQDLNSQSSSESEDMKANEFQFTVPISDTIPIEEETQLVEDPDCELNLRTQWLQEDSDCDEGEATDGTEVLNDDGEGSDDECGKFGGDDSKCLEKRENFGVRNELMEKGVVADFNDASNDRRQSSGSARRSFMSVRAASLRASGRAAASKIPGKGTDSDPSNEPTGINGTALSGTEVTQVVTDHGTSDDDGNENGFKGKANCLGGSVTARKLFTDDTFGKSGSMTDIDIITSRKEELPKSLDCDHNVAGLSYVGSQEPGQFSQENAMNVVDRFLSINDLDLSHEADPGKPIKGKSPPTSSAKALKTLAQRANLRSPDSEAEIFDWDDAREDEGGGDFFSKRREALFGSSFYGRRSFTQPRKTKHLDLRKDTGGEKSSANLHQKMLSLTCSDSRFALGRSKKDYKIPEISETKTGKNLFVELDKQLNPESSEQLLEETGVNNDVPDICDVGIGTQMAAEAMEALASGFPAHDDTSDANVTKPCIGGVMEKITHLEHNLVQNSTSDREGTLRLSKRRKILDKRKDVQTSATSRTRSQTKDSGPDSTVASMKKKGKAKTRSDQNLNVNDRSGRRSSKSFEQNRMVNSVDMSPTMGINGFNSLSKLNGKILVDEGQGSEDCRTFTPIATRTRRSSAVRQSEKGKSAFMDSGNRTNEQMEVSVPVTKRRSSRLSKQYSTRESSNLGSTEIGDDRKATIAQQVTPVLSGAHDLADGTTCEEQDVLNYHRVQSTCHNSSGNLQEVANLNYPSTIVDSKEVKGQSITRKKRSKSGAKVTSIGIDMKRKKQQTDGSSTRQDMAKPGLAHSTVNCFLDIMNEKTEAEVLVRAEVSTPDGKECNAQSVSCTGGVKEEARLEISRRKKIQSSGSACVTPIGCDTHVTPISPVCVGDDLPMQSCKKSLSRSSLIRELVQLDAHEVISTRTLKDFRKRKDMASARVLFSNHLDEDIIKQQKKVLARLGVSVACSSSEATHFVADKFVRTRNMLEAIAHGKPVVTHLWLESCGQASCFIDEKSYILRDVKKEKEIGFSMPVSLARACKSPLLAGKRVVITPNVKPSKEVVVSLVRAVHGQAVERIGRSVTKDEEVPEDLLVLSCEEDYRICIPFLEKGAVVYSSEILLNGIVIQKLEYARHRLFSNHVKRTRSTIWLRKDDENFLPVTKRK